MGTVLRFPLERCRTVSKDRAAETVVTGNIVILPAVRIERHQPDVDAPQAEARRSGRSRRRRSPRA